LKNYGVIFDLDKKETELAAFEAQATSDNFWSDNERAQSVLKEINKRKQWIDSWNSCKTMLGDLEVLMDMLDEDEQEETERELIAQTEAANQKIADLEFRRMLGGEDDSKNAILTIHPGAGGTESQDWAQMLMRMYLRYAEINGYKTETLDFQPGEEAGIKSVTIEVTGEYAYGYLRAENGVHRLVRISPFDANSRRHTSFASVFVLPEIDDNIDIQINPDDIRIDTFRASGAGGQHVNKTSSAIRITHIPTGTVVQCQNERSQHKNKANALKILASRLYQQKLDEQKEKMKEYEKSKTEISWGNQIRSYVFHPYNLVKDHRTDVETSNTQAVMDGDLNRFIEAFLVQYGGTS
jgi:peptide chain release factor 2